MAEINFNDGTARTTRGSFPAPDDRMKGVRPNNRFVGPLEHEVGTGRPRGYTHRKDWCVDFMLGPYKAADLENAMRFQMHFMSGGVATLQTQDAATRVYTIYRAEEIGGCDIQGPDDEGYWMLVVTGALNDGGLPFLVVY